MIDELASLSDAEFAFLINKLKKIRTLKSDTETMESLLDNGLLASPAEAKKIIDKNKEEISHHIAELQYYFLDKP